ncbi:type II toxin-antitoxin system VapC family toxin [Arabiibacter massiliensis]|uniref:type II toxin-antitoxin system VapC family toxin n=1 Tax=Arabiibacter massiliensis TaxID=1870985 RepID=UPI0009BA7C9E|nr:type II toxin-antitoxin system VapC family toxin [Arabiibacter massiliensis]
MTSNVVVVDTNVWLDYLMGDRPNHDDSFAFIVEAKRREVPLVIPSHALKDVFFIFQQQLKIAARETGDLPSERAAASARQAAWAALDLIMDLAVVGPSDQSDAWIAAKQRALHSDYEDNLVVATAQRLGARMLVTNDAKLVLHAPVAALTAADALAQLAIA